MCDFIRFLTNVLLDGPILTSQRSFYEGRSVLCQVLHEEEGMLGSILVAFPALKIRETAIMQSPEEVYKPGRMLSTFYLDSLGENMKGVQGSSGQEPFPNS